jgi:hypothetical protein
MYALGSHRVQDDVRMRITASGNTVTTQGPTLYIEFSGIALRSGDQYVGFKQGMSYKEYHGQLTKFVRGSYNYWIVGEYGKICSNMIGHPTRLITKEATSARPVGSAGAGYDYIVYYVEMADMISQDIQKILGDLRHVIFDNDKLADVVELKNILGGYRMYDFKLYKWLSDADRIDTTIHELVHLTQHLGQEPGKTEYRSKIEPNKEKFSAAMYKLNDPANYQIYTSSLQETPAHAHSAALQIIRSINFPLGGAIHANLTRIREQVAILLLVIKGISRDRYPVEYNSVVITSDIVEYYNRVFNHPSDKKLYPVYKRFVKTLHQELVNYAGYWVERLQNNS